LHGALLDTELLAEVYLGMTRGQESLLGDDVTEALPETISPTGDIISMHVRVLPASAEELALHETQIADIDKASKGACVWKQLEAQV
jgi:DNA polymerase-3 subunit epsilon